MNMGNEPLISIIVPVYNIQDFVLKCLKSLSKQKYQNIEIIIVDDGSTDKSGKICDDFALTEKRAKVFHKKNGGLSDARNFGIKKAKGEIVALVDGDDYVSPDYISVMYEKMKEDEEIDVVVCGYDKQLPRAGILSGKDATVRLLIEQNNTDIVAWNKLYKKMLFDGVSYPIGEKHEDTLTTYKILSLAKIIFLPGEYYIYHHHNNSITSDKFNDHKLDLIELTDQMCNDIEQKYPDLKNITNERRIRARFSILRQIPIKNPKTKILLNYLKNNKSYILKNPEATTIDKIALILALTNLKLFQFAYHIKKA